MKEFNITGLCIPEMHYMVDISEKINEIKKLVFKGKYFTINRARQYGKTTVINQLLLYNHLSIRQEIKRREIKQHASSQFININGDLDMELVLNKFQELMKEEYRDKTTIISNIL